MTLKVNNNLLTAEDCFACKKCCRYEPDELMDSPMLTAEQRQKIEAEFETMNIQFEQVGQLWRIVLRDIPGLGKKICPLYNEENGHCLVYGHEIFDCLTWPFYIMRKNGQIVIAVSQDCPIVNRCDLEILREYAKTEIGPKMLQAAERNPDLITEFHGNTVVLCNINDF